MKVTEVDINPVTQYIDINKLTPLDGNPRKISKEELETLKESIKANPDYFWARPCLVNNINGKMVVYAGNQRLKAAKALQMRTVPCIVETLSEEKQKERTIRDNVQNGNWDLDLLKGWDSQELANWGLDADLVAELQPPLQASDDDFDQETAYDTAKSTTTVKTGDIYQLGNHRLMCGDSTKPEDVDKLLSGEQIDLLLTDPPYGVDYSGKNSFLNAIDKGNRIQEDIVNDQKIDIEELYEKTFRIASIHFKEKSTYYIACGGSNIYETIQALKVNGYKQSQILVWVKNNHVLGRQDYANKHEFFIYGWLHTHEYYGDFQTTIWEIDKPLKNDLHPTMKPIELCSKAIQNSTKKDMNVLDLFGGSGSTLIACEQLDRKCFMMEIDPVYVQIIINRWQTLTNKKAEKV